MYSGYSPQFMASTSSDSLTLAAQLYEGNSLASSKIIHFTLSGNSYSKAWEKQLPLQRLVGMTSDGSNFYIASAVNEEKGDDKNPNMFRPNVLVMTKLDNKGNVIWEKDLNTPGYLGDATSKAIYSPLGAGTGALAYGAGKVIVALTGNTEVDANGFRHQRAQFFVVGANGEGYKAQSETSWRHSFDQRLVFDGQDFVFTDLGDAGWYMPGAGIAVRKIRPNANGAEFIGAEENLQGTYIYVRQSETANNQNFSFTSLGDLLPGAQGYLSLFTSETSNPSATRNGFEQPVNEPRNLGFVHVTRNFESVREGSWDGSTTYGNTIIQNSVPQKINITRNVVDSNGPTQTFSRPGDPGRTFTQTGIIWLTHLPAGVSAERPKLVALANGRYVALWEEWNYSGLALSHAATKGMIINEQGQILTGPVNLNARLNPSGADRPFILDGKATWITGDASTGEFQVHTVDTNLVLSTISLDSSGLPQPTTFTDHLNAGDTLKPGDRLQSSNGLYYVSYQTDGNLALYTAAGKFLWNTGTSGPAGYASMQADGNFAIYTADGRFQWNTGTTTAGSRLILRDNGNLLVLTPDGQEVWASNTSIYTNHLSAGDTLKPGERLQSSNGRYYLSYQTDGNLALYTADGKFLWNTGTSGPAGFATMQTDGNFAIYGPNGGFKWNTGTTSAGSRLVLQDDGNLVVYTPAGAAAWSSGTLR
ncbi:MAG TPA: hypothetical protein VFO10_20795 [Oligoflexus sp.]|uniref:hypothetical protein n=1 Tax=Oligoflexus sp. TaxID=1971216 RepID=UPI002D809239|nr:hypothetical protein [Oligoflexus sp.]HET9239711.1 hypothetical protein [Oligoflexus sp.]